MLAEASARVALDLQGLAVSETSPASDRCFSDRDAFPWREAKLARGYAEIEVRQGPHRSGLPLFFAT